jgi:hypothetical protein
MRIAQIASLNVSGFVVDTIEEAVTAVRRIRDLDRVKVRAEFGRRFTAERMAHDYVGIYRQLLAAAHSRLAKAATLNGRQSTWQAVRLLPSSKLRGDGEAQSINASR